MPSLRNPPAHVCWQASDTAKQAVKVTFGTTQVTPVFAGRAGFSAVLAPSSFSAARIPIVATVNGEPVGSTLYFVQVGCLQLELIGVWGW